MISSVRQGFGTGLSGISGTSIQSAYTKPLMEPLRAYSNISWLPFPYGPLPDVGPWSKKKETDNWENERDEKPVTPEPTPGASGTNNAEPFFKSETFTLVIIVACAWFLVKYIPGGK